MHQTKEPQEVIRLLVASEARGQAQSALIEAVLASMEQGLAAFDGEGALIASNARFGAMHDLPASLREPGRHMLEMTRFVAARGDYGPGDPETLAQQRWRTASAGGGLFRASSVGPDGSIYEVTGRPMPGGGFVNTYTDVTEARAAEALLRTARDKADVATRLKSEFLATMSHEIRSPMSGLVGVLELLRETSLDPDQARMAAMAHGSALVLLAVLNDILDFSKIEAGALAIVAEPTRLGNLVTDLVQPHVLAAQRKRIDLKLRIDAGIPDFVEIDPLRLRQILNNLIGNALKFTASGEVGVALDIIQDDVASRLRFAISDTGIGMTPEIVGRLFEPFMQANGLTTRSYGGTGLGLSISRRLAELLGGTLTAASRAGEGSLFTLLLPLKPASRSDASRIAPAPHATPNLHAGRRILVVDDDPVNRWLTRRQLELLGVSVDAAADGEAALSMLRSGDYDLLLTDCHMPRMDGVVLTQVVRAASDPAVRDVPIIGLTADVTSEQRQRCEAAGMNEVAIKPLSRDALRSLLSRHLTGLAEASRPGNAERGADGSPLFDDTIYREIFAPGDPDGEACLAEYLAVTGRLDDELHQLLAVGVNEDFARAAFAAAAHRLAGTSLTVGATRLGEAAMALEQSAAVEDPATLRGRHTELRGQLVNTKRAISAFIADWQLAASR